MENYEQEYKEAISRAKIEQETFLNLGNISAKTAIERIFPELHDLSETEIIENLYRLLCDEVPIGTFEKYGLACDAVFSWLEKQDEKKHAWSEEDEKKIELLIAILEVNHPNGHFKVNPINTTNMESMSSKELVDWLKSIKSKIWKPTGNN